MTEEQLRAILLDLFPEKEGFVNDFLNQVNGINEEAKIRVARAVTTTETETTETVVEETVVEETAETEVQEEEEEVVQEETVVEEEQAQEENTQEDETVNIELGETFVSDLVNSQEFNTALRSIVTGLVTELRNEFTEQLRSLQTQVEEQEEIITDVPARQKRGVVSYRPSAIAVATEKDKTASGHAPGTYQDIAEQSISDIFDN